MKWGLLTWIQRICSWTIRGKHWTILFIILTLLTFYYITSGQRNECLCDDGDYQENMCYSPRENKSLVGKKFSCHHLDRLHSLGLLSSAPTLSQETIMNPVFVTAFSQSHFHEGKRLIASIRKHHRRAKVVVYSLGLSKKNLLKIKKLCFVELRVFPFEIYPEYFKELTTFRWKPIVIAEALRDFGSIWYMDSSVILKLGDLRHVYSYATCKQRVKFSLPSIEKRDWREKNRINESSWNKVQWKANVEECAKSPYLLHSFSGHGIFSATDPALYQYFPTNMVEIKKEKAKMYEAGLVYAVQTDKTIRSIMKWYVLCALEEGCMGTNIIPNICFFNENDRYSASAHCHRFDQSAINVLLANEFYMDREYYSSQITDFFKIQRYVDKPTRNRELICTD